MQASRPEMMNYTTWYTLVCILPKLPENINWQSDCKTITHLAHY